MLLAMLKTKSREWIAFTAIIVCLVAVAHFTPSNLDQPVLPVGQAPEIENILNLRTSEERSAELVKLLERVGPERAQEEMLHSGLPFTGETHLLVHTIGNFIYDQYGKDGLALCKDYFLSACYHAVILNTLGDNGLDGVAEAMALCREAGGSTVAAQCAHGAGHGFVAWHDYDLVKALEMCDELGSAGELRSPASQFPSFNCYDGVFMENVWGVHEGTPSPKRWVKESELYYPCTDPRIPEKYLKGCWSNQATLIYQHFKGDLRKTALACDAVENAEYRETCYNNFSRQIHPMTQGSIEKVKSLCENATGEEWRDYCILTNMTSYWSVGDHELPGKLCASLEEPLKTTCFTRLENLKNIN